jgi:hypothetical protein
LNPNGGKDAYTSNIDGHATRSINSSTEIRKKDALREQALQLAFEKSAQKRTKENERREIMRNKNESLYVYADGEWGDDYYTKDDNTQTVIGVADSGASLLQYQRFISSLRKNGFQDNVIIGMEAQPNNDDEIENYLKAQNVIIKTLSLVPCTYDNKHNEDASFVANHNPNNNQTQPVEVKPPPSSPPLCYAPYTNIKREWAHFPLARDWIRECESCMGNILFTSITDTYFQKNPASPHQVKHLTLFEQHPDVEASKTTTGTLLQSCKNVNVKYFLDDTNFYLYEERIGLLTTTALGTRDMLNDYFTKVTILMQEWTSRPECHFVHSTKDHGMAIINYMRIRNMLPNDTVMLLHRRGIVNDVTYEGIKAYESHLHFWRFKGLSEADAQKIPYEGAKGKGWLDAEFLITNEAGKFINVYFKESKVIRGYEAFGTPYLSWLDKSLGLVTNDESSAQKSLQLKNETEKTLIPPRMVSGKNQKENISNKTEGGVELNNAPLSSSEVRRNENDDDRQSDLMVGANETSQKSVA